MQPLSIFLVGEVSSGKSSFLNALAGGIVSSPSFQRETFNPEHYVFSSTGSKNQIKLLSDTIEARHKENQVKRSDIASLKVENISKIVEVCGEKQTLPTQFGLKDYSIYDFPGINDSEDKDMKFFKAIENNISKCDLMIYITDVNKAFVSASEVESFKKIKKLVDDQNTEGQYIGLFVVVNKYDTIVNEDFEEICERIPEKINLSKANIFRCCSHKLLVSSVIKNKLDFYVPKFAGKEVQQILQGSNVKISTKLKENFKCGNIYYANIHYAENLDCDWADDEDEEPKKNIKVKKIIDVDGDWDDLIRVIKSSQDNHEQNIIKTLQNHAKNIFTMFDNISSYYIDKDNYDVYKYIYNLDRKIENKELPFTIIENLVIEIITKYYNTDKYQVVMSLLLNYGDKISELLQSIVPIILQNISLQPNLTSKIFAWYPKLWEIVNTMQVFKTLLSHPVIWNHQDFTFYDIDKKITINAEFKIPGKNTMWFISQLEANPPNSDIRLLLFIAQQPIKYLRALDKEGLIIGCDYIENNFDDLHVAQLIYYLTNSNDNDILGNKLFKLDDSLKSYFDQRAIFKAYFD